MSNCIELGNAAVVFSDKEMDLPALRKLLTASVKEHESKYDEPVAYCVWWFLKKNTVVREKEAVINFGRGHSSHTWRDFRALVELVIKPLMLSPKYHAFTCSDESDGFEKKYRLAFDFKDGWPFAD